LLQPLQGILEGYCRRLLRKRDQVEDVLQTVVALAFSQFDRYVDGTNFKAWIFRIATLEIANRNRKREPLLWRLAPAERTVLLLRAIGEFSYHEIHKILSIPVGSVMGYLSRARRKMRNALAEYAIQNRLIRREESRP
jgi:RNA polymerase sigma-70 factor (ECF subfamily)